MKNSFLCTVLYLMCSISLYASNTETFQKFIQEKKWPLSFSGFSGFLTYGQLQKSNLNNLLNPKNRFNRWQLFSYPALSALVTYATYEAMANKTPFIFIKKEDNGD